MILPVGTLVNVAAVILGSTIGLMLRKSLPERYQKVVFQAIGLFTLFLGLKMAFDVQYILVMVFALIIGGLLGEWMGIDAGMNGLSEKLRKKLKAEGKFNEGLITAFILFCMGSLTILGALEEGLHGDRSLLYTKSILDGFSAIFLTTSFGIGVAFSVIPLFIFQVGITLLAQQAEPYLDALYIQELSAVGGLMILAIGLNLLKLTQIKVANFIPALLLSPIILFLVLKFTA